ncbi:hypothetical protein [Pseudaminobacter soli (ex Li et al. 2025)]|uniref:Uncharacterized protein n=1 Tax=Pseudaminobacter soli (ex Li et al. 2025) TaxID=1295366 RepID=A0A2P7SE49_9HYPH|nr:hypothetical protein [Mesorhizobium soli]PSJ60796.1 hypothetical protein C7I85_12195 [Mesorhizobium soli]
MTSHCPEQSYIANAVAALETPVGSDPIARIEYQARLYFRDLCRVHGFEGARQRMAEIINDEATRTQRSAA